MLLQIFRLWSGLNEMLSISSLGDMVLIFLKLFFFSGTVKHSIFEIWKATRKRDLDPSAGMSGSVYVTQLMTLYAVSLKGCRKSCAFMSFLDKLEWGVGEKMFPGRRTWEQPSTCPRNNLEGHKIKTIIIIITPSSPSVTAGQPGFKIPLKSKRCWALSSINSHLKTVWL